jgi:hypothetical protein
MGKNWHDILNELGAHQNQHQLIAAQTIDIVRRQYLKALADVTGRNVIAYYSGFLSKPKVEGIDINDDDMNAFMSCIHGLDRTKGLDLILHTPGGAIAATEALTTYLHKMFGRNIRAIVPQIAMSAGTMTALSCQSIVMGAHSSLGPIDPQIAGIPADVVVTEFERAYDEIKSDPIKAHVWAPILGRYAPSFLTQCEYAVAWSKDFVQKTLESNMFADDANKKALAEKVVAALSSAATNKAHDKHINADKLESLKVKVFRLENDPTLQDAVLAVHHCFMHTMASTTAIKVVENHEGRAAVRMMVQPNVPNSISIGLGSPA